MNTRSNQSILVAALLLVASPLAYAVSDGNYDPAKQHCTGAADRADQQSSTEVHCHSLAITVRDGGGHEYFGLGVQQQPSTGDNPLIDLSPVPLSLGKKQTVDVWYDLTGDGTNPASCQLYSVTFDATGVDQCSITPFDWLTKDLPNGTPPPCNVGSPTAPSVSGPVNCDFVAGGTTAAPNPASGLHLYFGADDNLDAGEHDSAPSVQNGPSDGGAIQVNLDPASVMTWMANVMAASNGARGALLTHPLPLFDAGLGFCADGFCVSVQTTRRDRAYPGGTPTYQPVGDYSHHTFDPYNCSNDDQQCIDSGGIPSGAQGEPGANGPGWTAQQWNTYNGDPSIEPGVQFYEDPDAQGSPAGPVYPVPVIYVGTCGVIIGGGALDTNGGAPQNQSLGFPPGTPFTNSAGQIVIPTGCSTTN